MLMLSLLADILDNPDKNIKAAEIIKQSKKKKLGIALDSHLVNTLLEGLYHVKYVSKTSNGYSFQIDLLRQWIKRDHSIWRVMKEVDIESIIQAERSSSIVIEADSTIEVIREQKKWLIPVFISLVAIAVLIWWIFFSTPKENQVAGGTLADQNSTSLSDIKTNDMTGKPEKMAETEKPAISDNRPTVTPPANPISEQRDVNSPPPKKSPPTTTVTRPDPARQIEPIKSEMLESKKQAMIANAGELASVIFNKGISAENAADNFVRQHQYQDATEKYEEAQKHFADAELHSRNSTENAKKQLDEIIQQLKTVQNSLKPEHRSTDEYKAAEDQRKQGEQYNNEKKYQLAYNSYSEAVSLYQKAVQVRINQKEKIRTVIEGCARDMENKNIIDSKYIQDAYEVKLQEEWQPFFDLAENINIGMDIQDIEFSANKATVLADVLMKYSGAGGSGQQYKWKIELDESGTDWFISKISNAN